MRAKFNSRRLFGITRSKGKMYEFGLPENQHINIPPTDQPLQLFLLTIGILGDAAAHLASTPTPLASLPADLQADLNFAASYFDAVVESKFAIEIDHPTLLMASAAYYLARRPGSSLVLARRISIDKSSNAVERLLFWVLQAKWQNYPLLPDLRFGDTLSALSKAIAFHFHDGSGSSIVFTLLEEIRKIAYNSAFARDLLYIDLISAICNLQSAKCV